MNAQTGKSARLEFSKFFESSKSIQNQVQLTELTGVILIHKFTKFNLGRIMSTGNSTAFKK